MHQLTLTGGETTATIPKKAGYIISSLPDEHQITNGLTKSAMSLQQLIDSLDLDRGEYYIKVAKHTLDGQGDCSFGVTFLYGVTKDQVRRLRGLKPKWVSMKHTTDGPRYKCTLPGCDQFSYTDKEALLHEWEAHFGLDPFESTDEEIAEATSVALPVGPAKRGPGRPRKDAVA